MTKKTSPYAWLMQQSRSARGWVMATLATGLSNGILFILQAALLSHIVMSVFIQKHSFASVRTSFLAIAIIVILRAGLAWLKEYCAVHTAFVIKRQVRTALLQQLAALGPSGVSEWSSGHLATTVMEQVDALHDFFARYLPQMTFACLIPLAILIAVFPVNWIAATVLLVTAPLIPLFMAIIGMGAQSLQRQHVRALARMGGHFLDVLQGMTTLKIFHRAHEQLKTIARISEEERLKTMSVLRIAFFSSAVLEFFSALSIALLATYLGLSFLGQLHFGYYSAGPTLGVALFILILAPEFYLPLRELGTYYHARAEALAAADAIGQILSKAPLSNTGTQFMDITQATVELRDVQVTYQSGTRIGLDHFNLTVAPQEKLVIVGESGAGKTTLLNVLLGFVPMSSGAFLVNGVPFSQIDHAHWRSQIAWVGQTTRLFEGTIRDNLLFAKIDATEEELQAALRAADMQDFLTELPHGLDTVISEQGLGLSGGQAQRVALARAYLKNAPMLLLDEPTANLDPESEQVILKALKELSQGRTVIALTHRAALLSQADRVVTLTTAGANTA